MCEGHGLPATSSSLNWVHTEIAEEKVLGGREQTGLAAVCLEESRGPE